jgi:hypothetical protein
MPYVACRQQVNKKLENPEKYTLQQAMKAQREKRGTVLLFLFPQH